MSSSIVNAPNVGLFDARGVGQILHTLGSRFRAVEFADWCTIGEELVLRDSILLTGKIDRFPRHLRLALRPYLDSGVFKPLRQAFDVPKLAEDGPRVAATRSALEKGLTATTPEDATFEASRVLGAEAHTGIGATPLLRH